MAMAVTARTNGTTGTPPFAPTGYVEIDPLGVRVDATFAHPDIVSYAQHGGLGVDAVGSVQTLLVAGIVASRNAGAYALAEEARQATESLRTVLGSEAEARIRAALNRAVNDDGAEGAFLPDLERIVTTGARSVEAQALRLTHELKGAGEDDLPQIIEGRVRRVTTEVVESILKSALASDGPLGIHLAQNSGAIKDLRADLSKLHDLFIVANLASEQFDPAAAGREWQPAVLAEIARLSVVTGDRLEETGDLPAHGRSKRGDAVLHLASPKVDSQPKVVIECRTGTARLTMSDLRKAKENRAAEAALLLVDQTQALPKDAEELGFRAYWEERSVVLHHKPGEPTSGLLLATALQVARMFAQLAAAASTQEINQEVLRESLGRLEKGLTRLRPLRASATGIETEVGRIRAYAQEIEQELRGALGELSGLAAG